MTNSIYLINPRESAPGVHSAEVLDAWASMRVVALADLTMPTVAALVPKDWQVSICDERLEPADFDNPAKVIGITGKVSQRERMIELAAEFRRRGKLVMIGGPYATLNPDDMRPHADILVVGEIEEIASQMFGDVASGRGQKQYTGSRPDLSTSPIPRWDLYPLNRALVGQVQTSRGCPFECEFCDVIQYLGRKQRWKEPEQVVRELEVLYASGHRGVFLADDNFTVVRRRARALLERLDEWNRAQTAGRVMFSTQLSIDVARDQDMLDLARRAGLRSAFIGIESPNEDSLAETKKRQNLRIDLASEVRKIVNSGIMVMAGMIVGFDHDRADIFQRQAAFSASLPVPKLAIGMLVAPGSTPLFDRLKKADRINNDAALGAGSILQTNIRPIGMSETEQQRGMRWLLNQISAPHNYGRRIEAFAQSFPHTKAAPRPLYAGLFLVVAKQLAARGKAELNLLRWMEQLAKKRPELVVHLQDILLYYCQARYMLDFHKIWDPQLVMADAPRAA